MAGVMCPVGLGTVEVMPLLLLLLLLLPLLLLLLLSLLLQPLSAQSSSTGLHVRSYGKR